MAKRLGTFKKILAETLLLSSDKVALASLPWRGRTSFLPKLGFARQCGAGLIINQAAAELFYTRESRKRMVNGKGTEEKEDYPLRWWLAWRRLSFLLPPPPPPRFTLCVFYEQKKKNTFFRLSHGTVRGRDRWFRGNLIAWGSEL